MLPKRRTFVYSTGWCSDRYGSYASGNQANPTGPDSGSLRVLRGGSWGNDPGRGNFTLGYRGWDLGFRLARTP